MMAPVFTVAMPTSLEKSSSRGNWQSGSTTLITESLAGRVIEVDSSGSTVWQKTGLNAPKDAERLDNGTTLITESGMGRVIEVDNGGNILWQKTGLSEPVDAERLSNGNTLIAEFGGQRVIEVDTDGNIIWQKTGLNFPFDAERLSNGNTLIVEYSVGRIIEVDDSGNIVWMKTGLDGPVDVEIFDDGMLITEYLGGRVIVTGDIVWEITGLDEPADAEGLDNGNILIAEYTGGRIIEVNSSGNIIWEITGLLGPIDAERISLEPELELEIKFGIKSLTVIVRNIGDASAYDVNWSFDIEGGFFGFVDYHIGGSIDILPAGNETRVDNSFFLFGFGPIEITITISALNAEMMTETRSGFIFGIFIRIP